MLPTGFREIGCMDGLVSSLARTTGLTVGLRRTEAPGGDGRTRGPGCYTAIGLFRVTWGWPLAIFSIFEPPYRAPCVGETLSG